MNGNSLRLYDSLMLLFCRVVNRNDINHISVFYIDYHNSKECDLIDYMKNHFHASDRPTAYTHLCDLYDIARKFLVDFDQETMASYGLRYEIFNYMGYTTGECSSLEQAIKALYYDEKMGKWDCMRICVHAYIGNSINSSRQEFPLTIYRHYRPEARELLVKYMNMPKSVNWRQEGF
jgi:hypothetical protein